jgi:hypothetical protein
MSCRDGGGRECGVHLGWGGPRETAERIAPLATLCTVTVEGAVRWPADRDHPVPAFLTTTRTSRYSWPFQP